MYLIIYHFKLSNTRSLGGSIGSLVHHDNRRCLGGSIGRIVDHGG